jgi:hypothetical protein
MQNSVVEQQNELPYDVQNSVDIAVFPTVTFFIRGSIENTTLMDTNNITAFNFLFIFSKIFT